MSNIPPVWWDGHGILIQADGRYAYLGEPQPDDYMPHLPEWAITLAPDEAEFADLYEQAEAEDKLRRRAELARRAELRRQAELAQKADRKEDRAFQTARKHGFDDVQSFQLSRRWARLTNIQRSCLLALLDGSDQQDSQWTFLTVRAVWRGGYLDNKTVPYRFSQCALNDLGHDLAVWGRDHATTENSEMTR